MLNKILMPSGGQTTDEMAILKWYKEVGEFVKKGDILFDIETDKAILTVESYAEGTLLEIKYPENTMVKTGEIVALIGDVNEKPQAALENNLKAILPKIEKQPVISKNKNTEIQPERPKFREEDNRVLASPLAKNLARIENIKLEDVASYASKNFIKKDDVSNFIKNSRLSKLPAAEENVYFIDTTSMRRTIARRMKESISVSPHYIISTDIDMTGIIVLRNKLNKNVNCEGSKISYNDIIMKVVSKAIESYPLINSSYEGDRIKMNKDVNFGLAIAVETGIIVPVVKKVNKKSISEIAVNNSKNIEKVRNNKFLESDITGGTITLSNMGMFGIDNFTAIINQPESCILAVGGIIKKVVVVENEMTIRDMMKITGSFDHRVIDGAVGAAFLMKVKTILEYPELLLF